MGNLTKGAMERTYSFQGDGKPRVQGNLEVGGNVSRQVDFLSHVEALEFHFVDYPTE